MKWIMPDKNSPMEQKERKISIKLSPAGLVRTLFVIMALLFLAHLAVVLSHLVFRTPMNAFTKLFDVDLESNIPSFFNVSLFFIGAICFYLVGRSAKEHRRGWFAMAGIFTFLGIDEGSKIHEKLMLVTLRLMNDGEAGIGDMGWLFYAWIIPYGAATILLLLALLPWLRHLQGRIRVGLLFSGAIYVMGAVFMEAWSGKVAEPLLETAAAPSALPWLPCSVYSASQCFLYNDPSYVALYTIEELAEMTGLILCIGVLLRVLAEQRTRIKVSLG